MSQLPESKASTGTQVLFTGGTTVIGCDEVGRGCLAGPVVTAACILSSGIDTRGIKDSKKLSPAQRDRIYQRLTSNPAFIFSIGQCDHNEIDQINILQATLKAMTAAVQGCHAKWVQNQKQNLDQDQDLDQANDFAIHIDGNIIPEPLGFAFPGKCKALVHGDATDLTIAAASIIAKVTRDRLMNEMEKQFPGYGFQQHKGYGTRQHFQALKTLGPCPIHRYSFRGVPKVGTFISTSSKSPVAATTPLALDVEKAGSQSEIVSSDSTSKSFMDKDGMD